MYFLLIYVSFVFIIDCLNQRNDIYQSVTMGNNFKEHNNYEITKNNWMPYIEIRMWESFINSEYDIFNV
jgi:hypothetical protein